MESPPFLNSENVKGCVIQKWKYLFEKIGISARGDS